MASLSTVYKEEEKLYRGVYPNSDFWNSQIGKISSAVFKDKRGVSTDREKERDAQLCVSFLLSHLSADGSVVSLTVKQCIDAGILVVSDPKDDNEYHSLIITSSDKLHLTDSVAKKLARAVKYEYLDSIGQAIYKADA